MNADYCIYRDCGRIIQYEEGTAMIKCPWCSRAYLTREFSGEKQKIEHALRAGEQARTALGVSEAERRELQARLNRAIDSLSDIAKAHEGVERNTGDILSGQRDMARTLNAINAKQDAVDTRYRENLDYAFVLLEIGEFGEANAIFDEVKRVAPREPQVYLGKLMADMRVTQRSDLAKCQGSFAENLNYKLLMHFGDEALRRELEKASHTIETAEYSYEGEIKDGKRHGHGTCKYANGDVYVGSFEKDRRHGKGRQTYADGSWYDGDWNADDRDGQGTMVYANGDRYEGSFVCGEESGECCYFSHDGARYEGCWGNGRPAGNGVVTAPDGEVKEGYFAKGVRFPKGIQSSFKNWIACDQLGVSIHSFGCGHCNVRSTYSLYAIHASLRKELKQLAKRGVYLNADGMVSGWTHQYSKDFFCEADRWQVIRRLEAFFDRLIGIKADGSLCIQHSVKSKRKLAAINEMLGWTNIAAVEGAHPGFAGLKTDGTVVTTTDMKASIRSELETWTDIVQIAATCDAVFGLRKNGTVCVAGETDYYGGTRWWENITDIAVGNHHVVGLHMDGRLSVEGYDCNQNMLYEVKDWRNVVAVAAEGNYVLGVRADGDICVTGKCPDAEKIRTWNILF